MCRSGGDNPDGGGFTGHRLGRRKKSSAMRGSDGADVFYEAL